MSGNGSGRGGGNRGNRKKPFKYRERTDGSRENAQSKNRTTSKNETKRQTDFINDGKLEKRRGVLYDRPKWVPPVPPDVPLPTAVCAWCEKPIKTIAEAISEPDTGKPVHLDCVINRIMEREELEAGDTVGYIGGGRFGIIHYNNPPDTRDFKIKKIFEWESKENRSEWRVTLCDHFSIT